MTTIEQPAAESAPAAGARLSTPAARALTIVLGGLLAIAAAGAAIFGSLFAVGFVRLDRMSVTIPAEARAIEVETVSANIAVEDRYSGGDGRPGAGLGGSAFAAFMDVPRIEVSMRGTTAVIRVLDEPDPDWRPSNYVWVSTGDLPLTSITARSENGQVTVQATATEITAVSEHQSVSVRALFGEAPERVVAHGAYGTTVQVPEGSGPYAVSTPGWLDAFVERWLEDMRNSGLQPSDYGERPGVGVETDPAAERTIDVSGAAFDGWVSVGYASYYSW